jgi:RraA family protein
MTGFRILKRRRAVGEALTARFRALPVANISDQMARMSAGGPLLRPMHSGASMAGPALTVRTRPGDNLMIHKALDLAAPGDVVVVDGGGDLTNALIGEMMISYAQTRAIGGIVVNGSIRDASWIAEQALPVYAAGITHRGPYKDGPGEINVPVALGGMVIAPGDLVVGDYDGLVCVPYDEAEAICVAAEAKQLAEQRQMQAIAERRSDRTWVDAALVRLGCEIES